jgi:hypothetical protein
MHSTFNRSNNQEVTCMGHYQKTRAFLLLRN